MSAMKDYMMDIEELVIKAAENGMTSVDDVVAFVNTSLVADRKEVIAVMENIFGIQIKSLDTLENMC